MDLPSFVQPRSRVPFIGLVRAIMIDAGFPAFVRTECAIRSTVLTDLTAAPNTGVVTATVAGAIADGEIDPAHRVLISCYGH